MHYYVYVIKSGRTGCLYKGMTEDLIGRIATHNSGRVRSTKSGVPWVLVYHEVFDSRGEARKREIFLKSGYGRAFLKKQGLGGLTRRVGVSCPP